MIVRAVAVAVALLLTPAAAAAQTPDFEGPTPVSIADGYRLTSAVMGQPREINVWLPPGYADGSRRYPVVYLLDGGLVAQDFHHISGLAQLGSISGMMDDVIVVGVASGDRRNELTAPATDPEILAEIPTHGGSERFRRFLAEEVQPFIAGRYRTSGETAVIGESLAALFIVETFLVQPTLFDRYVAISPSLWWDREKLSKDAVALLAAHPRGDRTLLLTIADEGGQMQSGMDRLVRALRASAPRGLVWDYQPRPHEKHSTIYHGAAMDYLRRLYPAPAED